MPSTSYALALGSNRRHGRHGSPARTLRAALDALARLPGPPIRVTAFSGIVVTPALGPAGRSFANAAALVETALPPPALLARLKALERAFGRRAGRRWGPRVLDIDIILWSGGRWTTRGLTVPHAEFRRRAFVLAPLGVVAPGWRDPVTGLTVRQLAHRAGARKR